jgi:hypothetical protein
MTDRFTWDAGDVTFATKKANPYHDERGRFTSAPSGSGAPETAASTSGASTLAEGGAGLKQYIGMVAGMHGDSPNAYKMLLEHGHAYEVDDKSFIGGKPQQCYRNATMAVWADPSLTYVEGFVGVHGVPIAHAWTTDATGKVRDVTLGKSSKDIVTGYYGVPFKKDFLSETLLRSKVYGILTGGDNPRTVHAVVTADPAKAVEDGK